MCDDDEERCESIILIVHFKQILAHQNLRRICVCVYFPKGISYQVNKKKYEGIIFFNLNWITYNVDTSGSGEM